MGQEEKISIENIEYLIEKYMAFFDKNRSAALQDVIFLLKMMKNLKLHFWHLQKP